MVRTRSGNLETPVTEEIPVVGRSVPVGPRRSPRIRKLRNAQIRESTLRQLARIRRVNNRRQRRTAQQLATPTHVRQSSPSFEPMTPVSTDSIQRMNRIQQFHVLLSRRNQGEPDQRPEQTERQQNITGNVFFENLNAEFLKLIFNFYSNYWREI